MLRQIKVRALNGNKVPFLNASGVVEPGRFIGIDKHTGEVIADGELVSDHPQVRRHIARGQLELCEE